MDFISSFILKDQHNPFFISSFHPLAKILKEKSKKLNLDTWDFSLYEYLWVSFWRPKSWKCLRRITLDNLYKEVALLYPAGIWKKTISEL